MSLLPSVDAEGPTGDDSSSYIQLLSVHGVCLIMFLLTEQLLQSVLADSHAGDLDRTKSVSEVWLGETLVQ